MHVIETPPMDQPAGPRAWQLVAVVLFTVGWLIPGGIKPWAVFLRECSISGLSLLFCWALVWRIKGPFKVSPLALCALALALTPLVQWGLGLISVRGGAWITCAYLAGFALSIGCGTLAARADAGTMQDALFSAIGLTALATVGIQGYQSVYPSDGTGIWVAYTLATRLAGNFNQSNHAATFLLWGVCAAAWLWLRGAIKAWLAVFFSALFLTGVSWTVSRTAWLGLGLMLACSWYWRALWPDRRAPWVVAALCVYFFAVPFFHPSADASAVLVSTGSSLQRLDIWHAALNALSLQPWFGYGWGQIFSAQLAVAAHAPQLHAPMISAHNLVLDVLLSCGLLLGGLALCAGVFWLWRCVQAVKQPQDALMVIFVLVVLNHAMLEYPLFYAYMLLPFGLVLGALDCRLSPWKLPALQVPKFTWLSALALVTVLWGLVVKDYLDYQESYQNLVLHRVGVFTEAWQPPKAVLLNQLGARLELEELDPKRSGRSLEELQFFESVATLSPVGTAQLVLAGSWAMQGDPERARWWLTRFCSVYIETACGAAQKNWRKTWEAYPEISAISWPDSYTKPDKP